VKSLASTTVLVVDDDAMSREMVSRMLARLPVAGVLKASDGIEAIERIGQAGGAVDAAILDFNMPRMHGLQLLKKIRTAETLARPGLPCIMLSGHNDAGLHDLALALRANAFLQKPAIFGKLKAELERILPDTMAAGMPDALDEIDVAGTIEAILEKVAPARDGQAPS
jgi:CheY-like chemotaxis protein